MKKLVFATHNPHKTAEIKKLLPAYEIVSLADIDFTAEIEETGNTLQENALLKARTIYRKTGFSCFADDTGLEVDALNGAPGVYSARYAGEGGDADANMKKLLQELAVEPDRSGRFRTVIAYIDTTGKEYTFEGTVEGTILTEKQGAEGFGYDPLFLPLGYVQSFAQMTADEKNRISHRGRAVRKFVDYLNAREQ